jgi:hypothetical protein
MEGLVFLLLAFVLLPTTVWWAASLGKRPFTSCLQRVWTIFAMMTGIVLIPMFAAIISGGGDGAIEKSLRAWGIHFSDDTPEKSPVEIAEAAWLEADEVAKAAWLQMSASAKALWYDPADNTVTPEAQEARAESRWCAAWCEGTDAEKAAWKAAIERQTAPTENPWDVWDAAG